MLRQRINDHYLDMNARDMGDARIKQMEDRVSEIENRYINNIRNTKSAKREQETIRSGKGAYMSNNGTIWNDYELSRTNLRRRARSTYMGIQGNTNG